MAGFFYASFKRHFCTDEFVRAGMFDYNYAGTSPDIFSCDMTMRSADQFFF